MPHDHHDIKNVEREYMRRISYIKRDQYKQLRPHHQQDQTQKGEWLVSEWHIHAPSQVTISCLGEFRLIRWGLVDQIMRTWSRVRNLTRGTVTRTLQQWSSVWQPASVRSQPHQRGKVTARISSPFHNREVSSLPWLGQAIISGTAERRALRWRKDIPVFLFFELEELNMHTDSANAKLNPGW